MLWVDNLMLMMLMINTETIEPYKGQDVVWLQTARIKQFVVCLFFSGIKLKKYKNCLLYLRPP